MLHGVYLKIYQNINFRRWKWFDDPFNLGVHWLCQTQIRLFRTMNAVEISVWDGMGGMGWNPEESKWSIQAVDQVKWFKHVQTAWVRLKYLGMQTLTPTIQVLTHLLLHAQGSKVLTIWYHKPKPSQLTGRVPWPSETVDLREQKQTKSKGKTRDANRLIEHCSLRLETGDGTAP